MTILHEVIRSEGKNHWACARKLAGQARSHIVEKHRARARSHKSKKHRARARSYSTEKHRARARCHRGERLAEYGRRIKLLLDAYRDTSGTATWAFGGPFDQGFTWAGALTFLFGNGFEALQPAPAVAPELVKLGR